MIDDLARANELLVEMKAVGREQHLKIVRQAKEITHLGKCYRKLKKVVAQQQVELEARR